MVIALFSALLPQTSLAVSNPATISQVSVSINRQPANNVGLAPSSGAYLGMFVSDGKTLKAAAANGVSDPNAVNDGALLPYAGAVYGKQPALFLTYANFAAQSAGSNFPLAFANSAKALGAGIQIGWQPEEVVNGTTESEAYLFSKAQIAATNVYITRFIDAAKASGVPVFLRFASEMNGNWVPWNGNPALYKRAWIDVWNIVHQQHASNVKMVWSPIAITTSAIDRTTVLSYYPGNQYVDWIGESVYLFPYNYFTHAVNLNANIVDIFAPLYHLMETKKYGHKPFMISEGAAASQMPVPWAPGETAVMAGSQLTRFPAWSITQLSEFFDIPEAYPDVKAITWFNQSDHLANITANDINLTFNTEDVPGLFAAFKRAVANPLYLSTIGSNANGLSFVPWQKASSLTGVHTVTPMLTLPNGEQPTTVEVVQNGTVLGRSTSAPWNVRVDFSEVHPGQPLQILALDAQGNILAEGSNTASGQ